MSSDPSPRPGSLPRSSTSIAPAASPTGTTSINASAKSLVDTSKSTCTRQRIAPGAVADPRCQFETAARRASTPFGVAGRIEHSDRRHGVDRETSGCIDAYRLPAEPANRRRGRRHSVDVSVAATQRHHQHPVCRQVRTQRRHRHPAAVAYQWQQVRAALGVDTHTERRRRPLGRIDVRLGARQRSPTRRSPIEMNGNGRVSWVAPCFTVAAALCSQNASGPVRPAPNEWRRARPPNSLAMPRAPVAQMDRASDFGSEG